MFLKESLLIHTTNPKPHIKEIHYPVALYYIHPLSLNQWNPESWELRFVLDVERYSMYHYGNYARNELAGCNNYFMMNVMFLLRSKYSRVRDLIGFINNHICNSYINVDGSDYSVVVGLYDFLINFLGWNWYYKGVLVRDREEYIKNNKK